MPSAFVLLRCIGKAAVKNAVKLIPFAVGDVLIDAWDFWQKATREEQRPAEVQSVAQMSAAELRAEVARIVQEEAAALSAAQQAPVASYLSQVPAMVRRSLRRPSDPSGTTTAAGTVFRKAEDLLPLLPTAMPRFKAGDHPAGIGDWELVELLGVGGFGEVWKARNPYLAEPVALKFCLDSKAAEWLRNEAKLLGRIMSQGKHPGIVRLLNTFLSADTPCLEYEYVDGGDLAGFIQERRNGLPAEQAAQLIKGLAEIVGFAHRLDPPIVHRDLKPANILLKSRPDGKLALRITDFGIGALATEEAKAQLRRGSKSGEFLSAAVRGSYTPLYASPQQIHGDDPDPRDDVYALGVIWYQLLTGDLTKDRPGGDAWRKRLADRGMTPELLALLASSYEDERADRPASAVVLAEKLDGLLQQRPEKEVRPQAGAERQPQEGESPGRAKVEPPAESMRCPSCSAVLSVPGNCLGRAVSCPRCRTTFTAKGETDSPEEIITRFADNLTQRLQANLGGEWWVWDSVKKEGLKAKSGWEIISIGKTAWNPLAKYLRVALAYNYGMPGEVYFTVRAGNDYHYIPRWPGIGSPIVDALTAQYGRESGNTWWPNWWVWPRMDYRDWSKHVVLLELNKFERENQPLQYFATQLVGMAKTVEGCLDNSGKLRGGGNG